MTSFWRHTRVASLVCVVLFGFGASARAQTDPHALLKEADRLAWLRAWSAAERLYRESQKLFAERGDQRNALYSEISVLRGQLPRLPVPEVSAQVGRVP